MNKNHFLVAMLALSLMSVSLSSCEYDDGPIWESVNDINGRLENLEKKIQETNSNLSALKLIVDALENQVTISSVEQDGSSYTINFSDGRSAIISDGLDGKDAPVISMKPGDDGLFYWTLDGEQMLIDGNPVCANGIKGDPGEKGEQGIQGEKGEQGEQGIQGEKGEQGEKGPSGIIGSAGVTPQIRINPSTKEWEISIDGGESWETTGINAEGVNGSAGSDGDTLFDKIETTDPAKVIFKLTNGETFAVPRYDATAPSFVIDGVNGVQEMACGETKTYNVIATNISEYSIQKPDGWRVVYIDGKLMVTAPVKENEYAEKSGVIAVVVTSSNNKSQIVKFEVCAYELRVLTFEDFDAKFSPYTLSLVADGARKISKWSDLIDDPQYGGPMTYNDFMETDYYWYDENNTFLKSEIYQGGPYWNGGQLISNYYSEDYNGLSFMEQLTISTTGASDGHAGHNGSANFCVHNGYYDFFRAKYGYFYFGDGVERIVDHMYVINTCYALNSLANGDSFNTAADPETWVKLVAIGCDSSGNEVGRADVYLCKDLKVVNEWIKFDLSSLGKVAGIWFNFEASDDQSGNYGLNFPAYFAYDDVAVRF